MTRLLSLVTFLALAGCATAPLPGPISTTQKAIHFGKWATAGERRGKKYVWQATLDGEVWKITAQIKGQAKCGDTTDLKLDVQAESGKILNETGEVLIC